MSDKKIFIANLPNEIDKEDLESIFGKYGKIVDTTIKMKAGKFAFIEFQDEQMAQDSLVEDGKEIQGRRIRVEISQKRERRDNGYRDRDSRGGYNGERNGRSSNGYRGERNGGYNERGGERSERRYGERSYGDRPRNNGCFNCGDEGHKKIDCPKPSQRRDDGRGDRFRGRDGFRGGDRERGELKCYNCNRTGHKKQDCPQGGSRNGGRSRYNGGGRRSDSRSRSRSRSDSRSRNRMGYDDKRNYRKRSSPSYERNNRSVSKNSKSSHDS